MAKCIMLQGTASSVGKSLLTAALCRVLHQEGYRVAPFKAQNMSLNSFITDEGLEMGRAQVMQAEAANIKPKVAMNPILLKPSADTAAQVIIMGRVAGHMTARDYQQFKPELTEMVRRIFDDLQKEYDVVVIEGAGSPAEINLQENDLVNMGMAEIADAPVILIGDIDRGGVFASLYGTVMLLPEDQRKRIKGVLINKFRGDRKILKPGLSMLENLIEVPVLGVIPFADIHIEDEDSVTDRFLQMRQGRARVAIDIIQLPYLSNFTDFHLLERFPDIKLRYVPPGERLDRPDMVIIPGSKSTIADLKVLRESGLEQEILAAYQQGACIFGICAGYQMLGKKLLDPLAVESSLPEFQGMGLLDVETVFEKEKVTTRVEGVICAEHVPFIKEEATAKIKGYEIHMGRTQLGKDARPFIHITNRLGERVSYMDGAVSQEKRVFGTYLHGIFDEVAFTQQLVNYLLEKKGCAPSTEKPLTIQALKEQEYNRLAAIFRNNVKLEKILKIIGLKP